MTKSKSQSIGGSLHRMNILKIEDAAHSSPNWSTGRIPHDCHLNLTLHLFMSILSTAFPNFRFYVLMAMKNQFLRQKNYFVVHYFSLETLEIHIKILY